MADQAEEPKSLPGVVDDLRQLVIAYAKQETLEPLKSLGRFVAYGVAGSIALGIGAVLLLLGGLRLLQTQTGSLFKGNWSWLPYFTVAALCGVVVALAMSARARGARRSGGQAAE